MWRLNHVGNVGHVGNPIPVHLMKPRGRLRRAGAQTTALAALYTAEIGDPSTKTPKKIPCFVIFPRESVISWKITLIFWAYFQRITAKNKPDSSKKI
jgi:hypothetical protein